VNVFVIRDGVSDNREKVSF